MVVQPPRTGPWGYLGIGQHGVLALVTGAVSGNDLALPHRPWNSSCLDASPGW